jgi:hypothetical protein
LQIFESSFFQFIIGLLPPLKVLTPEFILLIFFRTFAQFIIGLFAPPKASTPLLILLIFFRTFAQFIIGLFAPPKLLTPAFILIIFFKTFAQFVTPLEAPPFFLLPPLLAVNPKASAPDYKPLIFLSTFAHLRRIKFFLLSSGVSIRDATPKNLKQIFLTTLPHLYCAITFLSYKDPFGPANADTPR